MKRKKKGGTKQIENQNDVTCDCYFYGWQSVYLRTLKNSKACNMLLQLSIKSYIKGTE